MAHAVCQESIASVRCRLDAEARSLPAAKCQQPVNHRQWRRVRSKIVPAVVDV
ncbi:hypothetical protein [uncultured Thiodictyon sp.]|uniref:hypothetical protein n=1 Tax=uncultured Thiodictyon sp. TaxID=1846217 RepID=UPI0025E8B693|nr:hypothetical protein [uncultured Thiodictyon sp.]